MRDLEPETLKRREAGMTRRKPPASGSLARSSAAEYLTFVAASGKGGVEAVYADENVWLSQKMMAELYDVEVPTINYHLKKVFEEDSVIRNYRITAADSKTYDTKHYNLSAIIAVGYPERAMQFRKLDVSQAAASLRDESTIGDKPIEELDDDTTDDEQEPSDEESDE